MARTAGSAVVFWRPVMIGAYDPEPFTVSEELEHPTTATSRRAPAQRQRIDFMEGKYSFLGDGSRRRNGIRGAAPASTRP
jgi:hypothetical protein